MDAWRMVHPDDRWLVRERDVHATSKLRPQAFEVLLNQDDAFKLSVYVANLERGMSKKEAASAVRKQFAYYYLDPADRQFPEMSCDDDAYLPFAMKKRLSILTLRRVTKHRPKEFSSFNAQIRDFFRTKGS